MTNRDLKNIPLWKIALKLGSVFIIILSIIKFFWNWIEKGNLSFLKNSFQNNQWIGYIISSIIGGLIYGFIVGYFIKKQASKQ